MRVSQLAPLLLSPWPPWSQGSGHSSPTALALAFCCSTTSSLGGSSGRSRASAPFTTHLVNDMLRACKQLVQTPAHIHARFAHWCCLFTFCECALFVLSCLVLSCPALPCPVLANFKWECITRHCSRTRCRRSKGRSVYVSTVLFVFVLLIWRLQVQLINFRVPADFLLGSGSCVHLCPHPRSEHLLMDQAHNPPT